MNLEVVSKVLNEDHDTSQLEEITSSRKVRFKEIIIRAISTLAGGILHPWEFHTRGRDSDSPWLIPGRDFGFAD